MNNSTPRESLTWLLILPAKRQAFPLNPVALTQAQASRRELVEEYRDALVFDGTEIRRVQNVVIVGPYGSTLLRRLLSRLTGGWRIAVQLSEPLNATVTDVANWIAQCREQIEAQGADLAWTPSWDGITNAKTIVELVHHLHLPPASDALDVF